MTDTESRLEQLERILEISRELASTVSWEPLLHKIVEAAAELTDSEDTAILLLNEQTGDLRFVTANAMVDHLVDIPVPIEGSIAGAAWSSGEPVIIRDARTDPRHFKEVDQQTDRETRSLLAVPLQSKEHRIGVLEAENKRGDGGFTQDDVNTMTVLAAQATVAIDNARLVDALQQAHDELEHRVEERTAELSTTNITLKKEITERQRAEASLRLYTEELEARNKELDAFAETVAHDLKNPLNIMLGFALTLPNKWEDLATDDIQNYLHIIAKTVAKMDNIIEELLLFASTREKVQTTPVDMGSVVDEVQGRLKYMIAEYKGEILIPDEWPSALGYGPWIEEVWVNYINNALKYGGKPPRVELGADPATSDGMVRFWVRDNGPGIPEEDQSRLFAPFTQLHQIRAKGHGLGLSIVHRIMNKLDGDVGLESTVGQGSVFSFFLPSAP